MWEVEGNVLWIDAHGCYVNLYPIGVSFHFLLIRKHTCTFLCILLKNALKLVLAASYYKQNPHFPLPRAFFF